MPFTSILRRVHVWPWLVLLLACMISISAQAEPESLSLTTPRVVVSVHDTAVAAGRVGKVMTVSMANYQDSVAGLTVWLVMNKPMYARFKVDTSIYGIDTIFGGTVDTAGTLLSGWETVEARSISKDGTNMLITAIADDGSAPHKKPLGPQNGGVLFRVLFNTLPINDTAAGRDVVVHIDDYSRDKFSFSNQNGTIIGLSYQYYLDTLCYQCQYWYPNGSCASWKLIQGSTCDSIATRPDSMPYIDTTQVIAYDGLLTILPCCDGIVGNVDLDGYDQVDISDLSLMVNFLQGITTELLCSTEADIDGVSGIDISDLSALVSYLTGQGYTLRPCP